VPNNSSIQTFLTASAQDYNAAVPEPATLAFVGIGVALIGIATFRRKNEQLNLLDRAAPAMGLCKIVHFGAPKHF
jgi:hypothetical protein